MLLLLHLGTLDHSLDGRECAAANDQDDTDCGVERNGLAEHNQADEQSDRNLPVGDGAVVHCRQVAASDQQAAQSDRTANDPQQHGTHPVEGREMNLGDPVGLARSHADNVHQDSDNTCTDNGEDEVVHTTSGGVSILAVAVEEHGSAIEHAGQQAEDVANHLLREFRSGGPG